MSVPSSQAPSGDLVLRDVPGPSALGGGLRRSADLLLVIAVQQFKQTYFNTALGYLWSLARPLLLFAILLTVFTRVFRLGSDVPAYPVLLLLNLTLFNFFSEATSAAVGSIVGQESVVRKTQFPRLVIPLSVVLTALFNLGPSLLVVLVFIVGYGVDPQWTWLLFPLVLLALLVLTIAVSMLLASLYPRYRDVAIMWSVALTALLYATPVVFPLTAVSGTLHDVLLLNPLAPLLGATRHWIVDPSAPGPIAEAGGALGLVVPVALYVGICALGVWVFRREAPRIAEQL